MKYYVLAKLSIQSLKSLDGRFCVAAMWVGVGVGVGVGVVWQNHFKCYDVHV